MGYYCLLEAPGYQGLLNKRKVCLINAAAATALLNYKGSLLNEDSLDNCLVSVHIFSVKIM